MTFDCFIAVDWSASATPSPKTPTKDAIYVCVNQNGKVGHPTYHRTRSAAMTYIYDLLDTNLAIGLRTFVGFDFAFGYPAGFAKVLTGKADVFAVWDWLAQHITDTDDNANNRFAVADQINRRFPGLGPFWGCPANRETDALPQKGTQRHGHGMAANRRVDTIVTGAQPLWKLFTTGSVGSQSLMGIPRLHAMRQRYGSALNIWPFEPVAPKSKIVLGEIYPSMMRWSRLIPLTAQHPDALYHIPDAVQVRDVCDSFVALQGGGRLDHALAPQDDTAVCREEGWIIGADLRKRAAA